MRALLRTLALTSAIAAVLTSNAEASTLTLDGQASVLKQLGSTVNIAVTAAPGKQVFLLADIDPGPTTLFSQSLPIGFTPFLQVIPLGTTSGGGTLSVNVALPTNVLLDQQNFFLLAAVVDASFPSGFDFSGGASLQFAVNPFAVTQVAGNPLGQYPHFQFVRAFNQGSPLSIAVDPTRFPFVAGKTAKVYVVAYKTPAQWALNATLADVTGDGANTVAFAGTNVQANTVQVDAGTLSGAAGTGLGVPYDVVVDLNQNAVLDSGDVIDGFAAEAGAYVVHDVTQAGPLAVTELTYTGGTLLGQNTFYPTNIAAMGQLPLVIMSHGNGHNYQWYDHIGLHLASYGYIFMSHENNTGPGVETASTTTLTNSDYFLANLATIGGGVLNGHVDKSRITWMGHSRGGEGITRAYDRIFDGAWAPVNYTLADLKLLSSVFPVDFLGTANSNPHAANYHLWTAGADSDVNGCASPDLVQTFHLHDRAEKARQSISLHGVGHGDFHNGTGGAFATGPCLVGKPATHAIVRGHVLPLIKHYIDGNIPAKDFLWRQWEDFRPIGAPLSACVVVDLMYRESQDAGKFMIDDFQTQPSTAIASSGATVGFTVTGLTEGALNDANSDFTANAGDIFNGFTEGLNTDTTRGAVFEWNGANAAITYTLPVANRDVKPFKYLSLRAAQATRHALTTAVLADLTFSVTLRDTLGNSSTISSGAFGGGTEEPYQRTGCGIGAGWANEFEVVRIRLTDFLANGSGVELSSVSQVELAFGPSFGAAQGRIGIDELELTKD